MSQTTQNNFATFAREVAYAPPPDQPLISDRAPTGSGGSRASSWFPSSGGASTHSTTASYQNGGLPTWGDSYGGGGGGGMDAESSMGGTGAGAGLNEWETRFGWRVDFEAALAYLLGPISALLLLILETKNDYVRFHAYQSAVYTTSLVVLQFLLRFILPKWLSIVLLVMFGSSVLFLAGRAYYDANSSSVGQGGIVRYHIPYVGDLADRWVSEE